MAVTVPGGWRRWVRWVVPSTVLILVAGVGVFATLAQGYPTKDVDLHDGGVWVTKGDEGLVGRFVVPIEELDVAVAASSGSGSTLELLQDGRDVFVSAGDGQLRRIDVVDVTLPDEGARVPENAGVALGGGVVAVIDPTDGRLWVRSTDTIDSLDTTADAPDATVGGDAAVTVGRDGVAHAVSGDADRLVTVRLSNGTPVISTDDLGVQVSQPTITAVGDRAVVASGDGRLVIPGRGEVDLPGAPALVRLQQAGPGSDLVAVATDDTLFGVPLGGGDPQVLGTEGTGGPAAPVQLGGCIYAAWSEKPVMARICPGATGLETVPLDAPNLTADQLEFRVNHDLVVLNQLGTGALFTFDRAGENLGNWDNVRPPQPVTDPNTDPNSQEQPPPDQNSEPVARDDEYGARPGQATLLPVLENDGDADGDFIIIDGILGGASGGRLSTVANGQALQLVLPPDAAGIIRFRYTIDDGRGGHATAAVSVTVRQLGDNEQPKPVRKPREATVEQGGTVVFHVLTDWRDRDGDPLVLAGASTNGPDQVRFTPDGFITFVDANASHGRKTVNVAVSDGQGPPAEGTVTVNVLAPGEPGPPQPRDDRVVGFAGENLTITPLANDIDPNTSAPNNHDSLRLSNVSPAPAGASRSYQGDTINFKATQPRTYYLRYEVTQGTDAPVTARIRIDIQSASAHNPPVAVADTVILRGTAPGVVDVLANDTDLDGDVLVVSSVTVPENSGLVVSVLDHRWLRVIAPQDGTIDKPIEYTVTDGLATDTGIVTVSRLDIFDNQPPTARDDKAQVRAGDVVTIDVLANDVDPEGGLLTLGPDVIAEGDPKGEWYVTGDTVRYHAPTTTGTASAHYRALDPEGREADGRIEVTIVDPDPTVDQPPSPATLQARVFAGTVTRVSIPLSGVDPDGDSVTLLGPNVAPGLGRVVGQGINYLDYEAYQGKGGTDTFTYLVRDPLGLTGTGTVRVGVVPRPEDNSAPVAVDDEYEVAPGATVNAPVLANDSDVDGDALQLEPLTVPDPAIGDRAKVASNRIVVTAPGTAGQEISVQYAVTDGRGLRSFATLRVVAKDGANVPPTAEDDWITHHDANATFVDVPVLDNDDDVDGPRSALTVEPIADDTGLPLDWDPELRLLRVGLGDRPRHVAYRVTDEKGATATAFVHVPPAGDQAPYLRDDAPEITITGGTQQEVDLSQYIVDAEGQDFRLTDATGISVSPQPGLAVVEGSLRTRSLTLQADVDYSGPGTLVVEVTDGSLTEGHRASVTIDVTVTPADGRHPTVACPPVQPRAGAPAITVDLRTCVLGLTPLQRDALTFTDPSGAPAGVSAQRDGARLRLSAARDAEPGTAGILHFTIGGPWGNLDAQLTVRVQAASLAGATTDVVERADAGRSATVDVTANDFNPFPGEPLTVLSVSTADGDVQASVEDGHIVRYTPGADFFGVATLVYKLQDALGDPDRVVDGRVLIHVIARPDPPGAPRQVSVGAGRAVVSFTAPDANGAQIEQYQLQDQFGAVYDCGQSTTCELTGLVNGRGYVFQARARNAVDWSVWSPPSTTITPDQRPDQPAAPTTVFGDGKVTVRWLPPNSPGTPVRQYVVEMSPGGAGSPVTLGATTHEWTFSGLTNGASYTFRVQASNSAPNPSEWSPWSAPEVPAGPPFQPGQPTAAGVNDGVGHQMTVNWSAPGDNGAPITTYSLVIIRAGAEIARPTFPGDQTSTTVDVDNGVEYTYQVIATNKAGASQPSPTSAPAIAHGAPFPVTSFSVTDHDGANQGFDGRVQYSLTPPGDNGMAISQYQFDVNGDGTPDNSQSGSSGYVTGLSNGTNYQIRVRACNDQCGTWSGASPTVNPYGQPRTPGAGASANGQTQINWSWSVPSTNGRAIDRLEWNVDGGSWNVVQPASNGGTTLGGYNPGSGHTIHVRIFDVTGWQSAEATASATTANPPAATITVTKGGAHQGTGCTTSGCEWVHVELSNFSPNATISLSIQSNDTGGCASPYTQFATDSVQVDGSGHFSGNTGAYYGYSTGCVRVTGGGASGQLHW